MPEAKRNAILDYVLGEGADSRTARKKAHPPRRPTPTPLYAFGGFRRWLDEEGYPAIKPPWGTLNAVDLNTGELKWKVPLGEYPGADRVAASRRPARKTTAVPSSPPAASSSSAPPPTKPSVPSTKTPAKSLWQIELPFGGNATPSTYMVDGRQYVVISAGGGKSGRPAGGSLVAFALPKTAL